LFTRLLKLLLTQYLITHQSIPCGGTQLCSHQKDLDMICKIHCLKAYFLQVKIHLHQASSYENLLQLLILLLLLRKPFLLPHPQIIWPLMGNENLEKSVSLKLTMKKPKLMMMMIFTLKSVIYFIFLVCFFFFYFFYFFIFYI